MTYHKHLVRFFQISLLILAIAIVSTLGYFWRLGFLDGSRAKNLHQATYILDSYEAKPKLNQVRDLVKAEEYKNAINKIRDIEKEFRIVHLNTKTQEFPELKKDFQKLKTTTTNLLSYPKTGKVLSVFNAKMNKFYDYVSEKNWRTLTRMSNRVLSQTKNGIKVESIDSRVDTINRDFNTMLKLTENSLLQRKDKSEILSRIKNLQVEMDMLKKYSSELSIFKKRYKSVELKISHWFSAVMPALTLQKIEVGQVGKFFVMGLGGLFGFCLVLLGISFPYVRWRASKDQLAIERDFESILTDRIMEGLPVDCLSFANPKFRDYCENTSRYINKRMSMGSIFQESLPLGSLMLDENLQVIWSNKQFCEDWMLDEEEMKKDYMTWDFLNKLTNLGDQDPVIEGLKHGVAGIYQIQVKPADDLTARPYEMYVAPVNYQGQRRIQLYFYDLRSLEQTIKDQAQGLINPIKSSLRKIKTNEFLADEETKYSFALAGIKDVFQLFVETQKKVENEKNELYDQLEILNGELEKFKADQKLIHETAEDSILRNKSKIESLKSFKDNVIELSSQARELERNLKRSVGVVNTNINALGISKKKVDTLLYVVHEVFDSTPQYAAYKVELKQLKAEVQELLAKLTPQTRNGDHFGRLKQAYNELDKKLGQLEVSLSKAAMIIDSGRNKLGGISGKYEEEQIQFATNEVKAFKKVETTALEQIEHNEGEIIEHLQRVFSGTKSQLKSDVDVHRRTVKA